MSSSDRSSSRRRHFLEEGLHDGQQFVGDVAPVVVLIVTWLPLEAGERGRLVGEQLDEVMRAGHRRKHLHPPLQRASATAGRGLAVRSIRQPMVALSMNDGRDR